MYEVSSSPIISRSAFFTRMWGQIVLTVGSLCLSLLIGMVCFRYFEGFQWIDCFLNAAMLLGGMGEIDPLYTIGGKIFAGIYAIYSGVFMIVCGGLLLAPIFHRILHKFHSSDDD
jgi:hypothetical protein